MKKWSKPEAEELTIKMTAYYNKNHADTCPACRDHHAVCNCGARKPGTGPTVTPAQNPS